MKFTRFTRAVTATAFAIVTSVSGLAVQAQAVEFDFNSGDLVLALWNNSTEYLKDLGPASTLFGTSTPISIDSGVLSQVNPSGGNPLKFSLYGVQFDTSNGNPQAVYGGVLSSSGLTSANTFPSFLFAQATQQLGGLAGSGNVTATLIPASDGNSFTTMMGTSSTLAGTFPVSTSTGLGGLLQIVSVNMTGSGPFFTILGQASLSADGLTLTLGPVAPVPIPAAVVLFGSGLIGLIGVARRSMGRQTA